MVQQKYQEQLFIFSAYSIYIIMSNVESNVCRYQDQMIQEE